MVKINDFIHLRKAFIPEKTQAYQLFIESAVLVTPGSELIEIINKFDEYCGEFINFIGYFATEEITSPKEIKVEIAVDKLNEFFGISYFDTVELLKSSCRERLPREYYIFELEYFSSSGDENSIIKSVEKSIQLFNIFKEISTDSAGGLLITTAAGEKIKLENDKAGSVLSDNFDEFVNRFNSRERAYNDEFRIIIKNQIISQARTNMINNVSWFSDNFDDFYKNVKRDYEIVISKFSFEKVYDEFIEKKDRYVSDLNIQLRTISRDIIALPAGVAVTYILKMFNIECGNAFDVVIFILTAAGISFWLFIQGKMLFINSDNLLHIEEKIIRDETRILHKNNELEKEFTGDFLFLKNKLSSTKSLSRILFIAVILLSILLFLVISIKLPRLIFSIHALF